jgi:hypothetical protein
MRIFFAIFAKNTFFLSYPTSILLQYFLDTSQWRTVLTQRQTQYQGKVSVSGTTGKVVKISVCDILILVFFLKEKRK